MSHPTATSTPSAALPGALVALSTLAPLACIWTDPMFPVTASATAGESDATTSATATTGDDETTTGDSGCIEEVTPLAFETPSDLGFSAEEALAGHLEPRAGTFAWIAMGTLLSEEYLGFSEPATLTLSYNGGEVVAITTNNDALDPACVDRLEITLRFSFFSESGSFAESGETLVRISEPGHLTLDPTPLMPPPLTGGLDIKALMSPQNELYALDFEATLTTTETAAEFFGSVGNFMIGDLGRGFIASFTHPPPEPEPEPEPAPEPDSDPLL